jgi:hypothetical protein
MQSVVHKVKRVSQNPLRDGSIAFILAFASFGSALYAIDPPRNIARLVAEKEAASAAERANYTYRQTLIVEEVPDRRGKPALYRDIREIIFLSSGERAEKAVETMNSLQRLRLTKEDFRDIYEVQSLLLTPDVLFLYETEVKGEETIEGIECWVLQIRPRQILSGQRLFDGMLWVDQRDFSVIRSEGRAVPQIRSTQAGKENLFPFFTTQREKVGDHWFPVHTHSDDTLDFSSGPIRTKMTIRYRDYKKFGAESKIVP